MDAETNTWQKVEGGGCLRVVAILLLLVWSPVALFFAFFWNAEQFTFAAVCAGIGLALIAWDRFRKRLQTSEDMIVSVRPAELRPRQEFVVTLRLAGDVARTVRWWRVDLVGTVHDAGGDAQEHEVFVQQEFAVDPEAAEGAVNELQMILTAPAGKDLERWNIASDDWFVRATIESDRGRLESGRVGVRIAGGPVSELHP